MREENKGGHVGFLHRTFCAVFFTALVLAIIFPALPSRATEKTSEALQKTAAPQSSRPSPALIEIKMDDETNDPDAIKIAEKLNPTYFALKPTGTNTFQHYARFVTYNDTRFLVYNPTDLYGICSAAGCPIFVYVNVKDNKWKQVGDFYGQSLVYDASSQNKDYPNMIVRTIKTKHNNSDILVYMWNGITYQALIK